LALDSWLAFAVASAALIAIPGPTVTLVLGHALASGTRVGLACLIGVGLGDAGAVAVSGLGFGTLLAASATLFEVLKWVGAGYLVWLGIGLWRAGEGRLDPARLEAASPLRAASQAFVVTLLNPKGILFFTAFMPQFVDPGLPAAPQILILGATFVVLAVGIQAIYVLLIGRARERAIRPGTLRWLNRIGGTALLGAGAMTALTAR